MPTRNPWRHDRFPHSKVEKVPQAAGITIKSVYGSIQHMHSRRAQQRLTPSSTCTAGEHCKQRLAPSSTCTAGEQSEGSLHPAHAQPESTAKAHSIQHMHSRRALQTKARSIQHMHSWRAERRLAPSSTCTAGEQSEGSLHPAHARIYMYMCIHNARLGT